MPRLDAWLVETGRFRSRQTAKRAIRDGLVTVDGKIAKPSTQVRGTEMVDLSRVSDVLMGHDKLSCLDDILAGSLISPGDKALDIGSSAGGFLEYLLERGAITKGIEISVRFAGPLMQLASTRQNLSVVFADAFKIDPLTLFNVNELDLLLIDVTTTPEGTVILIERFSQLLKHGGRLIAAFKSKPVPLAITMLADRVSELGYTDVHTMVLDDSRQEVHVTAIHM